MQQFTRLAFGLTGLLFVHVLNPFAAWLLIGAGLAYVIGERRQRSLRSASLS
jgi:hypothetical protein